jgi:hypothetical protein
MFVFYFAILSAITPPVALAAYAASSLAGSNPDETGFQAMRLGLLAFIVPYAFCYDGGLLLQKGCWWDIFALLGGLGCRCGHRLGDRRLSAPITFFLEPRPIFGHGCLVPGHDADQVFGPRRSIWGIHFPSPRFLKGLWHYIIC